MRLDQTHSEPTALPLERGVSLRERIYLDLRDRLQKGQIADSDRLVDVEIARSYGVSRMPAREALMQLVSEGFLTGTSRGFTLPRLAPRDIRNIYEVRLLVEPYAAGCVATNASEAGLKATGEALQQLEQTLGLDDAVAFMQAHQAFRYSWLDMLENERLAEAITRFAHHVQYVRIITLRDRPSRAIAMRLATELTAGLRSRDAMRAISAVRDNLIAAQQSFLDAIALDAFEAKEEAR